MSPLGEEEVSYHSPFQQEEAEQRMERLHEDVRLAYQSLGRGLLEYRDAREDGNHSDVGYLSDLYRDLCGLVGAVDLLNSQATSLRHTKERLARNARRLRLSP